MAANISTKETMDSRELGLVLGQQLLDVDDMHYGLWEPDLTISFKNLAEAQQRYTDQLFSSINELGLTSPKVLDIGCGTGHCLAQMLDKGFQADGLVPAPGFAKLVNEKLAKRPDKKATLFTIPFEEFPADDYLHAYDIALFSESFQYIPVEKSFPILQKIVRPGGRIIICDFFKTENTGDGQKGDGSFGGGHQWETFEKQLAESPFKVLKNEDITAKMSPNLELVNDLLVDKITPAGQTIGRYLRINYPKTFKLLGMLFKKKLKRLKYKYFSGLRSKEVFEHYKSYRHIVLELPKE